MAKGIVGAIAQPDRVCRRAAHHFVIARQRADRGDATAQMHIICARRQAQRFHGDQVDEKFWPAVQPDDPGVGGAGVDHHDTCAAIGQRHAIHALARPDLHHPRACHDKRIILRGASAIAYRPAFGHRARVGLDGAGQGRAQCGGIAKGRAVMDIVTLKHLISGQPGFGCHQIGID